MKKFKVFGYPWHVTHQYELAKLPFIGQYDLLVNPYRNWQEGARPIPKNMNFVLDYKPGYYDFAIFHIDQQAIYDPELVAKHDWARLAKGRLYYEVNKLVKDIPKIVINHMTPFHDHLETTKVIEIMKEMMKGNFMVVNSNKAKEQWGWGYTILHGLSTDEWFDLQKEPRCVIVSSKSGMNKAYRRSFAEATSRILKQKGVPVYWVGYDMFTHTFDEYREFLGRSLVFFMPTFNSPRPRSRTEAMLSGCCVVSTRYHDADTFIKHGVNGYLTSEFPILDPRIMDNPQRTAELIEDLILHNPDKAVKVGQEGKKTAQKLFNSKNFADQWEKFLREEVKIWK